MLDRVKVFEGVIANGLPTECPAFCIFRPHNSVYWMRTMLSAHILYKGLTIQVDNNFKFNQGECDSYPEQNKAHRTLTGVENPEEAHFTFYPTAWIDDGRVLTEGEVLEPINSKDCPEFLREKFNKVVQEWVNTILDKGVTEPLY